MTSGVYKITNTVTGKCYIGSSARIERRWIGHKYHLRNNTHHAKHMQNSWNKYGEKTFIFEIVYKCAPIKDIILFYEQLWIDFYGFENLYNQLPNAGSALGMHHSDKTKEKCRISQTYKMIPIIQINMSGEIIGRYESISEAARIIGAKCNSIRKSIHKYYKCYNSIFVKNINDIKNAISMHSEIIKQHREVMGKNIKKNNKWQKGKQVAQFDKKTLKQINVFSSTLDAERLTKINHCCIGCCAIGRQKTAGGYIWRYVDDKDKYGVENIC